MIGTLALLLAFDDLAASRFFPLVEGDHYTYEDTAVPGTEIEAITKKEINPQFDPEDAALIEKPERYFPVEIRQDGRVVQVVCYREKDNTLFQVGTGINKPIPPRPIMVVAKNAFSWEYYGDNISEILTEAIHYSATSQYGGTETVLGKPHQTLVVKLKVTAGPKKEGIEVDQVFHYAADVGLYEVTEDGHVGKNKVHHVRRLTKYTPGGSA